jgi:pimeloyl-ACP methyl ester carboxylesterase
MNGRLWKTAAALTGLTAGAAAAGAWLGYRTAFAADPRRQTPACEIPESASFAPYRRQMEQGIRTVLETPYERVTIRSYDGCKLVGKFYEGKPGAPLILFFHGYRSTAERDGSGGFQLCRERGWHILMPDQRAHGESEGTAITFGIRERQDCLFWAGYAARRCGPETPVFLWGLSMGAAAVLMAADLPLPEQVRGIVADCGFDTPAGILKETIRRRHWPVFPLYPLTALGARWFGGFRIDAVSALECVKRARVPVLLIHGEADRVVPCAMARSLRDACGTNGELLTIPGADHGISWYVDRPAYQRALLAFMERNL